MGDCKFMSKFLDEIRSVINFFCHEKKIIQWDFYMFDEFVWYDHGSSFVSGLKVKIAKITFEEQCRTCGVYHAG